MEMKYGRIAGGARVNTAIHRCFEHISEEDARKFVKKFAEQPHDGPQVMHTFRELVLGAFLCREGLPACYDMATDGQTPDWSVMDPDVKGMIKLVNFHIDEATGEEIQAALSSKRIWVGWPGSNEDRLYDRIWKRAAAYKEIRQRLEIPYVVGVFGTFDAFVAPIVDPENWTTC